VGEEEKMTKIFYKWGKYLKRKKSVAALSGLVLCALSYFLLMEEGIMFVIGFCCLLLGLAHLWVAVKR
jgi:hypothetical protein